MQVLYILIDKTKGRIFFTISFILFFLILHPYCSGDTSQQSTLTIGDFLIVEITEDDFTKQDIETDITDSNRARYMRRKLHSIFVREFRDIGKCIILDFWYPDRGIKEIDRELINELKESENVAIGLCGLYKGEVEYTHSSFLLTSPHTGSTIFTTEKENGITITDKGIAFTIIVTDFNADVLEEREIEEKHISMVVLDMLKIPYTKNKDITVPASAVKQFKRVSFSNAMANKEMGKNKIIILVAQLKGQKDIHLIEGFGIITGPEIICSIIMYLANQAIPDRQE
jgi:hypothetical protein